MKALWMQQKRVKTTRVGIANRNCKAKGEGMSDENGRATFLLLKKLLIIMQLRVVRERERERV